MKRLLLLLMFSFAFLIFSSSVFALSLADAWKAIYSFFVPTQNIPPGPPIIGGIIGETPSTTTTTPLGCNNVLTNGDFESGNFNNWYSNSPTMGVVSNPTKYVYSGTYSANTTGGSLQQQGIPLQNCGGYPSQLAFAVYLANNAIATVQFIAYPSSEIGTNGNPVNYWIYNPNTNSCSGQGNVICIPESQSEQWYYIVRNVQQDLVNASYSIGPYYSAYIALGAMGGGDYSVVSYYDNVQLSVISSQAYITTDKLNYQYDESVNFKFSGFTPFDKVDVSVNYPGISLSGGFSSDSTGSGSGSHFLGRNLPSYSGSATLKATDQHGKTASKSLSLNLITTSSTTTTILPTCLTGTATASNPVNYGGIRVNAISGSNNQWAIISAGGGDIYEGGVRINVGDSHDFALMRITVRLISVQALQDGTIVGATIVVGPLGVVCPVTSCIYGTATATSSVNYGGYKFYATIGSTNAMQIDVKDKDGNPVETIMFTGIVSGTAATKSTTKTSPILDVTITSFRTLNDGTVIGVDLVVGPIGTYCPFCSDSDGGKNYYVKGVAYDQGYYTTGGEDSCFYDYQNNLVLNEYYCENGVVKSENYNCPSDYTCKDGACIRTTVSACEWGIQYSPVTGAGNGFIPKGSKIQVVYKPSTTQYLNAGEKISSPNNIFGITFKGWNTNRFTYIQAIPVNGISVYSVSNLAYSNLNGLQVSSDIGNSLKMNNIQASKFYFLYDKISGDNYPLVVGYWDDVNGKIQFYSVYNVKMGAPGLRMTVTFGGQDSPYYVGYTPSVYGNPNSAISIGNINPDVTGGVIGNYVLKTSWTTSSPPQLKLGDVAAQSDARDIQAVTENTIYNIGLANNDVVDDTGLIIFNPSQYGPSDSVALAIPDNTLKAVVHFGCVDGTCGYEIQNVDLGTSMGGSKLQSAFPNNGIITNAEYNHLQKGTFYWKSNAYDYHEQVDISNVRMRHDYGTTSIQGMEKMQVQPGNIIYEYVFDQDVNFGGSITNPEYTYPVKIKLMGKDFLIVGAGANSIKILQGSIGTATVTIPVIYGDYSVYAVLGSTSSVQVVIKDKSGSTVDNLLLIGWSPGTAVSKDSIAAGLTVTVTDIKALQDGTIVGVNMVVGPTGTTVHEYDTVADVTSSSPQANDCFPTTQIECTKEGQKNYFGKPPCCSGLVQITNSQQSGDLCVAVPDGSGFCTKCGDGICGPGENKCNCPKDCGANAMIQLVDSYCTSQNIINTIIKNIGTSSLSTSSIRIYVYPSDVVLPAELSKTELPTVSCPVTGDIPRAGCILPTNCDKFTINPQESTNCKVNGHYGYNLVSIIGPSNSIKFTVYCPTIPTSCEKECKGKGYNFGNCRNTCQVGEFGIGTNGCPQPMCAPCITGQQCPPCPTYNCCCSNKQSCPYECCENDPNYLDKTCLQKIVSCTCACPVGGPCPPCECPPPVEYVCIDHKCIPKSAHKMKFYVGWNMFSIPVKMGYATTTATVVQATEVFTKETTVTTTVTGSGGGGGEIIERICTEDSLASKIWYYSNGNYVEASSIEPGKGYWVKMKYECVVYVTGEPITIGDFPGVNNDWNQIGSPTESVKFSTVIGDCKVLSGPWKYNTLTNKYEKSEYLAPRIGYWIRVESSCTLGPEVPPPPPLIGSVIGKIFNWILPR